MLFILCYFSLNERFLNYNLITKTNVSIVLCNIFSDLKDVTTLKTVLYAYECFLLFILSLDFKLCKCILNSLDLLLKQQSLAFVLNVINVLLHKFALLYYSRFTSR